MMLFVDSPTLFRTAVLRQKFTIWVTDVPFVPTCHATCRGEEEVGARDPEIQLGLLHPIKR